MLSEGRHQRPPRAMHMGKKSCGDGIPGAIECIIPGCENGVGGGRINPFVPLLMCCPLIPAYSLPNHRELLQLLMVAKSRGLRAGTSNPHSSVTMRKGKSTRKIACLVHDMMRLSGQEAEAL